MVRTEEHSSTRFYCWVDAQRQDLAVASWQGEGLVSFREVDLAPSGELVRARRRRGDRQGAHVLPRESGGKSFRLARGAHGHLSSLDPQCPPGMELIDAGTSKERSAEIHWVDQPLEDQGTDPKLRRVSPNLEINAGGLPENLHCLSCGSGANRELGNWFELVRPDAQGLHGGWGYHVGKSIPAVNVGGRPDFA